MSTKIQFPNTRLTPPSLGKPIFATDIQNLTENLLQAMKMLLGLPDNGFAILQGLDYDSGAHTYNAGYIYLAGNFYFCATGLAENQYLAPDPTDTESKLHNPDGNSYNTYTIYYALASNSVVTDCPQFVGDMDQYRFNMTAMIGSTVGKVPVIGSDFLNQRFVTTDTDGKLNAGIQEGINTDAVPSVESTLIPGQIVKVGSTGLVSDTPKDHYGSGVTDSNGYCHVVHNLNIPTDNQIIMLSLQTNAGDPSASWQGKTVNDFLIYTPGMYENIPINWHLHDTR